MGPKLDHITTVTKHQLGTTTTTTRSESRAKNRIRDVVVKNHLLKFDCENRSDFGFTKLKILSNGFEKKKKKLNDRKKKEQNPQNIDISRIFTKKAVAIVI